MLRLKTFDKDGRGVPGNVFVIYGDNRGDIVKPSELFVTRSFELEVGAFVKPLHGNKSKYGPAS